MTTLGDEASDDSQHRDESRRLDPVEFGAIVAGMRILDGRNTLDRDAWRVAGWTYRALGRR